MTNMTIMKNWIIDDNGNRASVEYWGSEEAARASLSTLRKCSYCTNCTNCSNCSRCINCSYCTNCSYCSDCSDCLRCSDCSDCSRCTDCLRCSYCSDCSDCLRCTDCSRCLRCSDCSRCSSEQRTAPVVPSIPHIHSAVFAAASQEGALDMSTWHCGTTHCRAGWVIALAGDAGKALEAFHNTELAAMLIYRESGSPINPARFYDDNAEALADMKRLAEQESTCP